MHVTLREMRHNKVPLVSDVPPLLQIEHSMLQNLSILAHMVSIMMSSAWEKIHYTNENPGIFIKKKYILIEVALEMNSILNT